MSDTIAFTLDGREVTAGAGEKAVKLMEAEHWDAALLKELSTAMRDASICGLGQAAPNPLLSALAFFPEDVT